MTSSLKTLKELNLDTLSDDFFRHHSFIEASAGTGKTYTIQHLLSKMIESDGHNLIGSKPVSISEILLVTFTEKAAGELRNRIRKILEDQFSQKNHKSKEALERLEKALRSIDQAPIYTFHSFCDRILSQYSFEAGITENRQLVDKSFIRNLIERRCRDIWIKDSEFEDLICNYSIPQEKIISDLTQLLYLYNPETMPLNIQGSENLDELKEQQKLSIRETVLQLLDFLNGKGVSKLTRAKVNPNDEKILTLYGNSSLQKDLDSYSDIQIQNALNEIAKYNNTTQKEYDEAILEKIQNYKLNEFYQKQVLLIYKEWQDYEKDNSLKTFDDIIQTVYNHTKQKNSLLIPILQKSYRYAIIDEFQDTNYYQWQIFKHLFLDSEFNRLIVVGDPKQSIYSFQEANIQVYQNALKEIGEENGYRLLTNYRSSSSMIQSCNTLFDFLFEKQNVSFTHSKSGKRDTFKALYQNQDISPLYFGERESTIEDYVAWCVNQIQLLVNHVEIQNDQGQKRTLTYADIAILSRTRSEMLLIERSLASAGIPFSRYKDSGLFKSNECIQLATFLQAITTEDNSYTSQKMKRSALITPFVGKTLDEAYFFDFENREDPFFLALSLYQNLADRHAWPLLIETLFKQSQIEKRLLQEQKFQEVAKYRQLAEYALECLTRKHWSLSRVVSHLFNLHEDIEAPIAEESELIARDSDQNMVQIMTIHASKGLEFPVVFLVAGFKAFNPKDSFLCISDSKESLKRLIVKNSPENKEPYLRETFEEARRLFYVAMTRAQYLLFLPQIQSKKNSPLYEFLQKAFTSYLNQAKESSLEALISPVMNKIKIETTPKTDSFNYNAELNNLESKFQAIKNAIEDTRGVLYCKATSYSKIAHGEEHQTELGRENKAEEPEEKIQANSDDHLLPKGTDFGNAVHEILEFIDFEQGLILESENLSPEIKSLIQNHFLHNGLIPYSQKQIKLTAEMVKNTLLARLPKLWNSSEDSFILGKIPPEKRRAEMQFNMGAFFKDSNLLFGALDQEKPTWFFNGFIDLVFEIDGRFCILDWKTDSINDYSTEGIEEAMREKNYTVQRALYSFVLIEWLATLKNVTDIKGKETIYDELFGGVYYSFLRGTKMDSAQGFHCSRYPHYEDLLNDLYTEVSSKLKNVTKK